jgi:hypothetical protein
MSYDITTIVLRHNKMLNSFERKKMKGFCPLIALAMAHGQDAQIAPPTPPASFDFFAANTGRWAITVEISGAAKLDGDVLRLFIDKCSLFRPERFNAPIHLVSVASGISRTRLGDTWEILRRSEQHQVRQRLSPGNRLELEPFELTIPIEQLNIERGDLLTFQLFEITEINGVKRGGHVPIHARIQWPESLLSLNKEASAIDRFRAYFDPVSNRIDGEIRGSVSQQPDGLSISIDSCVLSSSSEYANSRREIVSIEVLIARTVDAKLTVERTGESHTVEKLLNSRGLTGLQPFELRLSLSNYSKHPTDRINLRIISTASEGVQEATYLHIPYALP